jgi:radical SAM superfamily enzyme YgiQ (UPF0313 family)
LKSCIIVPPSLFLDSDKVFPQLGPYYIKRFVEERSCHTVDILDESIEKLGIYDLVGFSVTTPQYFEAKEILKKLNLPSEVKTVIGGPHCLNYEVEGFDYVIRKDGCKPFLSILDGEKPKEENDDNDQLPHRDGSLHKYKYYLSGLKTTVVITSRGCPNRCYFCEHAGFPIRLKSPNAVRNEVKECKDLGFEAVMFFDDLFCMSLKRVRDLCEVIKPLKMKFRCFAHAKNFTKEMAKILSESGCVEIGYGAEHADQLTLDLINKKTKVQQNYDIIKIAHKHGIRVKAFLMIGLPGENKENVSKLRNFIETSDVDDYDVSVYFPYKGTYIRDHSDKFDIQILNDDSLGYYKGREGRAEVRVRTSALSSEEIGNLQRELWAIRH